MKAGLIVALQLGALALAAWAGHHVGTLSSAAELAKAQTGWATEREQIASQRADAINARLIAEHKQAKAINEAAQSYEKGKTDAESNAAQAIADLATGNRRLRDQWATCQATTTVAVSAASSGGRGPDEQAGLREDGIRRVLSAVGQCQAQRDALQQALMGERVPTP